MNFFSTEEIKKRLAKKELRDPIVDKFTRYVKVETTSDSSNTSVKPSTQTQFDLARMLEAELKELGFDVSVDQYGYVIGTLPATPGFEGKLTTLLIAHMDTSDACSGKDVKPILHENYDGNPIEIGNGVVIDTSNSPRLANCIGDTIITSDGTTLLGADDKAGIANIMTAVEYVIKNGVNHGPIKVMFNTDEEIGNGMDNVPLDKIQSDVSVTIDSSYAPLVESQCFNAYQATIKFQGFSVHPGYARGKLVNAANMAAQFITMIPRDESPEATDEAYGYFYVSDMSGDTENARVVVNIRDFDADGAVKRCQRLKAIAMAVEAIFPGGKVIYEDVKQYQNMLYGMNSNSMSLTLLKKATINVVGTVKEELIRGGTDGSHLTEIGIPTPNLFAGGENMHSRSEYASLSQMIASAEVIIDLLKLASEHDKK